MVRVDWDHYLLFKNTDDESAQAVEIEEPPPQESKLLISMAPHKIAIIHPGEERKCDVSFYSLERSPGAFHSFCLAVKFENSRGKRFRRRVRFTQLMYLGAGYKILCQHGRREIVPDERLNPSKRWHSERCGV